MATFIWYPLNISMLILKPFYSFCKFVVLFFILGRVITFLLPWLGYNINAV